MEKKRNIEKKKLPRYKRIIRLWCWKFSKKMELTDKVGHANDWALSHPKRFMSVTVGILSFLALTTIFPLIVAYIDRNSAKSRPPVVEETEIIGDRQVLENINGIHQLDSRRDMIRQETKELTDKGMSIKNELDSLMALPEKSYDDSIRIVQDYNNLEDIVNFLNKGMR